MGERVGELAVFQRHLAMGGSQSLALAIVNGGLAQDEFLSGHVGGVTRNARESTVQVGELQQVVVGFLVEVDALPESGGKIIGQVVEHAVKPVAPQYHFLPGHSLRHEATIYVHPGVFMEIKRGARREGERRSLADGHRATDDDGLLSRPGGILADGGGGQQVGVPCVGLEVHFLLHAAFQGEH